MYTKSCLFNARSGIFSNKLTNSFRFLKFVYFLLDPGTNPVPKPECITVLVPVRKKSFGSCGIGSATL
jgi:hypothetical protein